MTSTFVSMSKVLCALSIATCIVFPSAAAIHYVDVNSVNPVAPYDGWSTAAANIQDAVDASQAGDEILVTNGVYQEGGRVAFGGSLTNRVVVDKAVTVESINGSSETSIVGYQEPGTATGTNAIRCVYLMDGAKLIGFTIQNGATLQLLNTTTNADANGGGVWCESSNVMVSNCVIVSNSCSSYGAGIYSGTIENCEIDWNAIHSTSSFGGGAAANSVLTDSTIASNYFSGYGGETGAGAYSCILSNCVINRNLKGGVIHSSLLGCTIENNTNWGFYNGGGASQSILTGCSISGNQTAGYGGGAYDCVLTNCIVSNNSAANSGGGVYCDNFQTNAPGENNTLIGNSSGSSGGGLYLGYGPTGTKWSIIGWTFATNSAALDGGGFYLMPLGTVVANCTFLGNSAGRNGGGFCPQSALDPMPVPDSTFSGNIAGGTGGGAYHAALNNCVVTGNRAANGGGVYGVANNCVINGNTATGFGGGLSFNGGSMTVLTNCEFTNNLAASGGAVDGGVFSNCVFAGNSALTNGGAAYGGAFSDCLVVSNQAAFGGGVFVDRNSSVVYPRTQVTWIRTKFIGNSASADGAGICCSDVLQTSTNCLLFGNSAAGNGGGIFGGIFGGGIVCSNGALNGGGGYNASFSHCLIFSNTAAGNGGGSYGNKNVAYCSLSNNVAVTNGGGTYNSALSGCLETGNSAATGGGSYMGSLNNSTIVRNNATIADGGMYSCLATSSIIYDNSAPTGSNYFSHYAITYCCINPLPPPGTGDITNDPAFINPVGGSFRLQTNSPCINIGMGSSGVAIYDLDGRPRVVGGRIDIGAYEFQGPGMGEFTAWLQQNRLPTDGSVDHVDTDGDGMNNWQEWLAGTDPTSPASVLKLMPPAFAIDPNGVTVTWQSVSNRTYFLQRSDALSAQPPFLTIQSNIVGQAGTTSYTDTNAPGFTSYFYRVGIQ